MNRNVRRLGVCLALILCCFAPFASAVVVTNQAGTVLFHDNFDGPGQSVGAVPSHPQTGSWTIANNYSGSFFLVTNAASPGPAEGTNYMVCHRGSINPSASANFSQAQTTGFLTVRWAVYIPSGQASFYTQFRIYGDAPAYGYAIVVAVDDSAPLVTYLKPNSTYADAGVEYTTDTWQNWVLVLDAENDRFKLGIGDSTSGWLDVYSPKTSYTAWYVSPINQVCTLYIDAPLPPAKPKGTLFYIQ